MTLVEPVDPGKYMFDFLSKGVEYAVMHNDVYLHEREDDIPNEVTLDDDFFDVAEPYVCEKKEYTPRKLTLREKIQYGV